MTKLVDSKTGKVLAVVGKGDVDSWCAQRGYRVVRAELDYWIVARCS